MLHHSKRAAAIVAAAFLAAIYAPGASVARDGGRGYSTNFGNMSGGGAAARVPSAGNSARSFAPSRAAPPTAPTANGRANYRTNFDFAKDANRSGNWQKRQAWRGDHRRHRGYRPYIAIAPYGYYNSYASDDYGCGYYYSKWRRTGSSYWRHRYEDCIS